MGWRFRRRVKVAPGVWANVGKRGTSWSFGGRGYTVNVGKRGVRRTISLPGTGLSYTAKGCGCLLPALLLGGLVVSVIGCTAARGWTQVERPPRSTLRRAADRPAEACR